MRYLIINADDFGYCPETNRAVAELMESGNITSTSLISCAPAAEEAADIAVKKGFSVGAHLTINSDADNYLWKACTGSSSLTDEDGFLLSDTERLARKAKGRDVETECLAQLDYLINKGVSVDHIDNHCGTLYGINKRLFFINAFRISRAYKLRFRFPSETLFFAELLGKEPPFILKALHKGIVITAKIMKAGLINNMYSNPQAISEISSFAGLEEYYLNLLTGLTDGINEIFLHPSYDAPYLNLPEWKKRCYELEILTGQRFMTRIREEGIRLISYKDISSL